MGWNRHILVLTSLSGAMSMSNYEYYPPRRNARPRGQRVFPTGGLCFDFILPREGYLPLFSGRVKIMECVCVYVTGG